MGTKPKENLIYGSTALKHWLPNIKREPKDLDYLSKDKIKGADCSWHDVFQYVLDNNVDDTYVDADILLTIKMSHMHHKLRNGSWWKHYKDILFLHGQGVRIDKHIDFFYSLRKVWDEIHGKKEHIKLNKTGDKFFNNDFGYNHDDLHEYFKNVEIPIYKMFLKDYNDVLVDKEKFHMLPTEYKMFSVLEETSVIAFERKKSLMDGFQHVITNMSKGFWNEYIVLNIFDLHVMMVENIKEYNLKRFNIKGVMENVSR